MSEKGLRRSQLLHEAERLYTDRAWSDIELSQRLGVDRTTIYKARRFMEEELGLFFIEESRGHYRLDPQHRLANIRLTPTEALALYLGGRRLQQQTRTGQMQVATALEKLARALRRPMMEELTHAAKVVLDQGQDPQQSEIMEKLVEGWTTGRKIRIWYRALHGDQRQFVVSPYQLEPAVWGDGVYLIGYSEPQNRLATFKMARIERAAVTMDPFSIPESFDSHALLQHAWGIWHSDRPPEIVRLRFSAAAAPRVRESIWHPSQIITDTPDGGCLWEAQIAEVREMEPWVRGWGADVEVLEPEELRDRQVTTIGRLQKIYQTSRDSARLPHQLLYAKTNRDHEGEIHLLLYHLIDVGQVADVMWRQVLTDGIRQRLADMVDLTVDETGRWFTFFASLHDLGKAGPAYQKKYAPTFLKQSLVEAGLGLEGFGRAYDVSTPHGTVSTWALNDLLPELTCLDERFARQIAVALGGHHGQWPPPGAEDHIDDKTFPQWDKVRRDLFWELQAVFRPPEKITPPANPIDRNTFLTILSGFVSVADWLGSRNKECFGFIDQPMSTRRYAIQSASKANQSLVDLGWLGWQPTGAAPAFMEAFAYRPSIRAPHQVQSEVIAAAAEASTPTLVILEAPTGIGKTEVALYLADRWLQQQSGRGLYVAMPTQATSNQMYGRVGQFLNHRYPEFDRLNFHLVHGQAAWQDRLKKKVELQGVGDDSQGHVVAESWFTPRKRTLLAPFGVGTVDQTLMSILQTRHFFVRLLGLSHKVLIFDEVHAYDTFMNTLFHRLLEWLNAVGTSVIILSATLPTETRRELVQAYCGQSLPASTAAYPLLTIATTGKEPETVALTQPADVTLMLNQEVGRDPAALADYLCQTLAPGGCAAVICNTVARAQAVYRALDEARRSGQLDIPADDLILFHARFPPIWRQAIETTVLAKFGKDDPENRPQRAIVVATQVVEQSLDLDFDVMVTDLAPIDLLIQRAGRLHRHQRTHRYGHGRQLCLTRLPLDPNGLPDFEKDRFVYEPYLLLRTFLTLRDRPSILIPGDTTALVESVYGEQGEEGPLSAPWAAALAEAKENMESRRYEAGAKAAKQLIVAPGNVRLLRQRMLELDEESPEVHETIRAQTRDIDPGITLVCLHREEGELFLLTEAGNLPVDLNANVPEDQLRDYHLNTITLQHRYVFQYFINQPVPAAWRDQAALRTCRSVVFDDGVCALGGKYTLKLSRESGLEIIKTEE